MLTSIDLQLDLVARLLVSAVLGAIIGLERELHDHPAGMRTHLLVALGSAGFTILSVTAFGDADPSRVAAQVVTGVGFLGAGAILKEGATIRGLTTAASLWAAAAVGMAAGVGAWLVAMVLTGIVVASLWPLRLVAERFVGRDDHRVRVQLATPDPQRLRAVVEAITEHDGTIAQMSTTRQPSGGLSIDLEVRVPDSAAGVRLTTAMAGVDGVDLVDSKALAD